MNRLKSQLRSLTVGALALALALIGFAGVPRAGDDEPAPAAPAAAIWQTSGQSKFLQADQPAPEGWVVEYHALDVDYVVAVAPDGAVNVTLRNLQPSEGIPVDQPIDPQASDDAGSDASLPTPMKYRWSRYTAQPVVQLRVYQQTTTSGKITQTWIDVDVGVKFSGVARQLRYTELPPDASSAGWTTLPVYGPEFDAAGESAVTSFRLRSQDVPALNAIHKSKFRPGAMVKVVYQSDHPLPEAAAREEEEFPNRTFVLKKSGMVRVKRANGNWTKCLPNMDLGPGDQIITLSNGEVVLVLGATAVIRVPPDSELLIPSDDQNTKVKVSFIQMMKGVLWARARKDDDSLRVATPSAVAGCRGNGTQDLPRFPQLLHFSVSPAPESPKETVTCVKAYVGPVWVWQQPSVRGPRGELVAKLETGQSICVGLRGLVVPPPDTLPDVTPPATPDVPPVAAGKVIELEVGKQPAVTLGPNDVLRLYARLSPGNPFDVSLGAYDRSRLQLVQERTEELPPAVGPGGKKPLGAPTERRVFEFKPATGASGEVRLTVEFKRPWENAPSSRRTLDVRLGAGAGQPPPAGSRRLGPD